MTALASQSNLPEAYHPLRWISRALASQSGLPEAYHPSRRMLRALASKASPPEARQQMSCSLLHLQFLMVFGLSRAGCWPKQYVPRLAPLGQAAHSQAQRQRLTETRQRRQVMPCEVQLLLQHLVQAWAVQAARPQLHHYHAHVWQVTHPRVWTWDDHRWRGC